MDLIVNLSDDDLAVLDAYVKNAGLPSRSVGIHRAIRVLRFPSLERDYRDAWAEWSQTEDAAAWASID